MSSDIILGIKSNAKIETKETNNNIVNTNSFIQGFLIAIFNPKILIWFTAIYSHFIRVEADEVTYPLHIIILYEIEKGLFDGSIKVKNLPEIWSDKMEEYFIMLPGVSK